jgi:hypothetical protein
VTLEPGVHEPSEAPWWEFTSDLSDQKLVRQWMGEAARAFAEEAAGEGAEVEVESMSADGMVGFYAIISLPDIYFTVLRGALVDKP